MLLDVQMLKTAEAMVATVVVAMAVETTVAEITAAVVVTTEAAVDLADWMTFVFHQEQI